MTDVLTEIITMVSINTNVEAAKIDSGSDFDSLGFDSLSAMEMAAAIRREFSVDVDDEELARCKTVGEMAAMVTRLLPTS